MKVLLSIDLSNKYFIRSKDDIKNVYVQLSCGNIYDTNQGIFKLILSIFEIFS